MQSVIVCAPRRPYCVGLLHDTHRHPTSCERGSSGQPSRAGPNDKDRIGVNIGQAQIVLPCHLRTP